MPAWIHYRTFLKNLRREMEEKSKHNLIILITEAAKALNTSQRSGLCPSAPCNFLSEILLATYHMSTYWQSFRTQAKHHLLHQILPDSSSQRSLFPEPQHHHLSRLSPHLDSVTCESCLFHCWENSSWDKYKGYNLSWLFHRHFIHKLKFMSLNHSKVKGMNLREKGWVCIMYLISSWLGYMWQIRH